MARTALSVASVVQGGVAVTPVTPDASGATFVNTEGKTFLQVFNDSASPITVTIKTNYTVLGLALSDQTITVAAGVQKIAGPFTSAFHQDGGNKIVNVDFSAVTSVTAAAFKHS